MATLKDLLDEQERQKQLLAMQGEDFTVTQPTYQGNYSDMFDPSIPLPPARQYTGNTLADIARNPDPNWSQETKDALARRADLSGTLRVSHNGNDVSNLFDSGGGGQTQVQQPGFRNTLQIGDNAPVDLGRSQRSHDVWADGPQEIGRKQLANGTTEIIRKIPVMRDGRQSVGMERLIETPDYLNPAMLAKQKFEKGAAEIAQLNAKQQVETPQQKLANEIIAAEARSKLPYTAEGARLAEQTRADAKAKAGEEGKALPISAAKGLMENQQNLRRAQEAQALLNGQSVGKAVGDKEATGWKGYAPDALLQRFDPAGIDTRAAIADLGSLVIHDRSGAAVTAMEFPRLRPFIPSDKDDPATARKKLNRFVMEYTNIVDEATGFYKESGYKVPSEKLKNADIKRPANDGIPPMETWVAKAKELNPDMSGAEIEAEYMKKYRR